MADYQYSTGEGIAFSGKAQTFDGLRSRMLGIEHEKRKAQDKGIAELQDFNIGTGKYYPLIANKIAEEKMNFLNDLQKDIKQYGKTQAINRNWLKKQEVANRIKRYEMTNDLVSKAVAIEPKSFSPRAENILSVFSNPNATTDEIVSLNDPDAGITIDENLNFSAYRFPKADVQAARRAYNSKYGVIGEPERVFRSGNKIALKVTKGLEDDQLAINDFASDTDLMNTFYFANEAENKKKYPKYFSGTDSERMDARKQLAAEKVREFYPKVEEYKETGVTFEPTYYSKERKEETPVVSGNSVTYKNYRWTKSSTQEGYPVYSFSPVGKDMPKFDLSYDQMYADIGGKAFEIRNDNDKKGGYYIRNGKKNYLSDISPEKMPKTYTQTKQLINVTSAQLIKKPSGVEMHITVIDDPVKKTKRNLVIKGKYSNADNIGTIESITGLNPDDVDRMLKGEGSVVVREKSGEKSTKQASKKKWTYNGITATEEEWLQNGWTIEKLEKHAK